jgi:hypothetical protein
MPSKQNSLPHQRSTLALQRSGAKKVHYEILKQIKTYNENNEPVGFKKLCETLPTYFQLIARFIREAESWGMVESHFREDGTWGCLLTVTSVGEVFLQYYEKEIKKRETNEITHSADSDDNPESYQSNDYRNQTTENGYA